MSRARALLAAALAAAALTLAACGGDDSDTTAPVATAGERSERIVVEAEEGAFSPRAIYAQAAPGVVTVRAILPDGGSLLGRGGQGQGSGFVLSGDGEIVTNAHVVTNAQSAGRAGRLREANEVFVQFADRNQVPAEIVGVDPFADVALLEVDPDGLDLHPLELGSSEALRVGAPVAAIGSPFAQEQSLSTGVISATDRSIESLTRFRIDNAIQTDASINPGNSGGPLLDARGRVLGINQQINTTSGGNQGVGFAVPVDLIERSIEQLREDGEVDYAFIGVTSAQPYPQLAERLGIEVDNGALVTEVVDGSPAEEAGIEGGDDEIRFQGQTFEAGGDVIVAVDGHELVDQSDLPQLISRRKPGDEVTLDIIRDGKRAEIEVTLGERPASGQ